MPTDAVDGDTEGDTHHAADRRLRIRALECRSCELGRERLIPVAAAWASSSAHLDVATHDAVFGLHHDPIEISRQADARVVTAVP